MQKNFYVGYAVVYENGEDRASMMMTPATDAAEAMRLVEEQVAKRQDVRWVKSQEVFQYN